ncbi:ABC transporter substrate-binding protein [Nocardioides rubriscoriae]|uniref:ABC transporter substrate-binding protein n=1 Tax=Nocardioides rubriscoriae TaxID=642762 RepID=UPI0014797DD0|nr:extracellular solute-binding protein [Nocardioides rubriscoriae]
MTGADSHKADRRHPPARAGIVAVAALLVTCLAGSLVGCTTPSRDSSTDTEVRALIVWRHAGTDAEARVFADQVDDFNATHPDIRVTVRTVAEGDYNDALQTAVAAREVPDVAEIDGPLVDSYVYQDQLADLDQLLPTEIVNAQLTSLRTQGQVDGRTYSVAVFDSGLGLYADRRQLRAAHVAWPTGPDDAWTAAEFSRVLARLAARDDDARVLDLKLNYGVGEWLTYGFAPLVASAGGDLIDHDTLSPVGHLDGDAAVRALGTLAEWAPYVDPDTRDDAFTSRSVALSWVGHWVYRDYAAALGDDLLVLPQPDLGHGSKSGQGSWSWAITKSSRNQQAAATFLTYLLGTDQVLRMTDANGAVPGTDDALDRSDLYGPQGPLRLFAAQLLASCADAPPTTSCVSVPRPATPAYPTLSAQFSSAVSAALTGGDWRQALRVGTERVQADLDANDGYR